MVGKQKQVCLYCKKEFFAYANRNQKFCSKRCGVCFNVKYRPPSTMVKIICKQCGRECELLPCKAKVQKYCCQQCGADARRGITTVEKTCPQCGKAFRSKPWRNQKFCSNRCGTDFHKGITRVEKVCPECGKTFKSEGWRNQKFCSVRCGIEFNRGRHKWKRSRSRQKRTRGYEETKTVDGRKMGLHRHLMEKELGRRLESCETVHHIDMDKHNNSVGNLYVYSSEREHMIGHHSLGGLVRSLIDSEVIKFESGIYLMNGVDEHSTPSTLGSRGGGVNRGGRA